MEAAIDKRILLRMRKELKDLETSPPLGVVCYPLNDNIVHLQAEISGPEDTPYSTGTFKIDILIPDRYPFEPPRCQFQTRVYHPNIDEQGRICLDILKSPPKGSWGPAISISTMLISLRLLLATPNPDDPLLVEVANEFKENRDLFMLKAKQYTERYATGYEDNPGGEDGVENVKFIPSRACELQDQDSSSPSYTAPSALSIANPHPASLLTLSQTAFSALTFSGSSLPQPKTHSGVAERKTLKKPGLKKPSLGSTRPTEGTVSTTAATTANTAPSPSTTVHLPLHEEAAASDRPFLITVPITADPRMAIEQPHFQTQKKSLGSSLHPSAEDTVAATDLSITHEDWKHDHPSKDDAAVAADSTISSGKRKRSPHSVEDTNTITDSQLSKGSCKREISPAPTQVCIEIDVPSKMQHSKGMLRSRPAPPLAAPGTDLPSTVESETTPRSVSASVTSSGALSSRPEEINCTSPASDPSERTTCEAPTATPSSNPSCDEKPDKAPSPPFPSRLEPPRARHGSNADLDQPLVISRHFNSSSPLTEYESQKRQGGGKDEDQGPEKDKHAGKGKRRALCSIDLLDPGTQEAADTDENAGAGSLSFYNQRDGGLHNRSAGETTQMAKAAAERNSSTAADNTMAPLTIARKRNLLKKHKTTRLL